jgi:hypothetical protein
MIGTHRVALAAAAGLVSAASLVAVCSSPTPGPDVTVAELIDLGKYTNSGPVNGFHAYAIGTESLNRGDQDIAWCNSSVCQGGTVDEDHPVIAQNLYRWKTDATRPGGRFEQVGMSWLKHGFTALAGTEFCASCTFEAGHSSGDWLGMGCEDPYWAGLNGSQGSLGPRSEVNATNGQFPYPFLNGGSGDATLRKRMLVATSDLENTTDPNVRYFAEGQYIARDDAEAGNGLNNASFREVAVSGGSNISFGGEFGGYPGQQLQEAIRAWKRIDAEVEIARVDYEENFLPARFNLAAKVHDNGDGTWRYEYALHNLNSHRSAFRFVVAFPPNTQITNVGSRDIDHHSGEPYLTTAWSSSVDSPGGSVTWETLSYASDPNANALRWGTLFNFWFDADEPPGTGGATVHLFRPGGLGEPDTLPAAIVAPGGACLYCDTFETGDTLRWSGEF